MHPVLQIAEILLNVFSHWQEPCWTQAVSNALSEPLSPADLFALARTCRRFKEPALDTLWSVLTDLTPVVRCIPHVCYQVFPHSRLYSFSKPLEQAELDALRGYTHRIHAVHDFNGEFYSYNVEPFLAAPTSDPLFPNMRHLRYLYYGTGVPGLLHQPLPSLVSITFVVTHGGHANISFVGNHLERFPRNSPNLGRFVMDMTEPKVEIDPVVSDFICHWQSPRVVSCPWVTLNINAFKRLSHVSDLNQLSFTLKVTLTDRITRFDALCFNKLQKLELHTKSLVPAPTLLNYIQLPVLTELSVTFEETPTKQNVAYFFKTLSTSGICNSIRTLNVLPRNLLDDLAHIPGPDDVLNGDDLRPLMALRCLRHLNLDLKWNVELADYDLVDLVPAWPDLESLCINGQ